MSWASVAGHFLFDPVIAALNRAATSSNASAQAQATATLPVAKATSPGATLLANAEKNGVKLVTDTVTSLTQGNSAMGITSGIIGDLENGLSDVVDVLADAYLSPIPIVGGFIDSKAKEAAKAALVMAQQHAMTYLAAKFGWHLDTLNALPNTPAPVVADGQPHA